jgi:hypothetical protein
MNNPSLARRPDENEIAHRRRVRKYITKNAPAEHRYFVRGGKPGSKHQRWFVPGLFVLLGMFIGVSSYMIGADVRTVNGPNGAQGEFVVENVVKSGSRTKASEDPKYVPVVTIRGEAIVPLNSKPSDNKYAIGDVVNLRYSQQGKVVASFLNEDGEAETAPSYVGMTMGAIIIIIGLLVAKFYRGAVDPDYMNKELSILTK